MALKYFKISYYHPYTDLASRAILALAKPVIGWWNKIKELENDKLK